MYGATMGKLVLERYDGATWSKLWEMSGNKGDVWFQAVAALPAGTTQLRFTGTTTTSYTSDFALDDLLFTTKPVPVPTTTTTQGGVSSFVKVDQGTCQSNGLDPIYDKNGCSAAALALGYRITWGPHGGYPDVVSGCSVRKGMLFLEGDDGSCKEGNIKGSCSCSRYPNTCLCKSRAGTSSTTTQAPTTLPLTTQAPSTLPPTQPPTPTTQPPMPTSTTTTGGDVIIPISINASEADDVDIKVSIVK
jgi:hypothetical protein